jgi:ferredoxin
MAPGDGGDLLARVRERLAREGLHIVLAVGRTAFDNTGGPRMRDLLALGSAAIVVGDGGPGFFSRFRARTGSVGKEVGADPLDGYTRTVMENAVADLCGSGVLGHDLRLLYPFVNARPCLPFQRLGQAAGLPPPGPLGIQIHPVYGPWWAYRALLIVSQDLIEEAPVAESCVDCARPCVAVCPGRAVMPLGFAPDTCMAHRRSDPACRSSCIARIRCPVGTEHRYSDEQLAFHMAASFPGTARGE